METIKEILNLSLFEISLGDVLIIVAWIFVALLADKGLQSVFNRINNRPHKSDRSARIHNVLISTMKRPLHLLCLTIGCGLGLVIIDTPSWGRELFAGIFFVMRALGFWCFIWYMLLVINNVTEIFMERAKKTETKLDDMLIPIASTLSKGVLIGIGVLFVMQNLGFSISSLVAGLGIGGAAIALASKDTLANLFGSIVVFFDHPFEIGDWISLNGVEGCVEEIRLRTTLIRTVENSLIMMPNQLLTNTYINNFERRECRKMDCSFGVLYSTTREQIHRIVDEIKEHLAAHPEIFTTSYYVAFEGFGASSLDITVIAYTLHTGKADHLADKQEFMFKIMEIVERNGSGFAFPTRTLELPQGTRETPMHIVMEK